VGVPTEPGAGHRRRARERLITKAKRSEPTPSPLIRWDPAKRRRNRITIDGALLDALTISIEGPPEAFKRVAERLDALVQEGAFNPLPFANGLLNGVNLAARTAPHLVKSIVMNTLKEHAAAAFLFLKRQADLPVARRSGGVAHAEAALQELMAKGDPARWADLSPHQQRVLLVAFVLRERLRGQWRALDLADPLAGFVDRNRKNLDAAARAEGFYKRYIAPAVRRVKDELTPPFADSDPRVRVLFEQFQFFELRRPRRALGGCVRRAQAVDLKGGQMMWYRMPMPGTDLDAALAQDALLRTVADHLMQQNLLVATRVRALREAGIAVSLHEDEVLIHSHKDRGAITWYLNSAARALCDGIPGAPNPDAEVADLPVVSNRLSLGLLLQSSRFTEGRSTP